MISEKGHRQGCSPRFSHTRHTFSIPAGSDGNERIVMWAFIPDIHKHAQPSPVNSLPRSAGLPHIAKCFAAEAFDFRHLGDSTGSPRQVVSATRQQEDYISVLQYVSDPNRHQNLFGRCTLDPNRIVLWGWSNSGGHVSYLAGRSDIPAISAVIAIDPLCDGAGNFLYHLRKSPGALFKITHRIWAPVVVPALGPGGFLGSEEAERGARQLTPIDGPPFVNHVAARYGFDVRCPIMVSWSRDGGDGLIPSYLPQKLAEDARAAGTFVDVYEHIGDHFAIHPGGCAFEESTLRQLQFLAQTVGTVS
ncbi:esterase [Melampsora americana]|nr:esterase [Melampsora americana]